MNLFARREVRVKLIAIVGSAVRSGKTRKAVQCAVKAATAFERDLMAEIVVDLGQQRVSILDGRPVAEYEDDTSTVLETIKSGTMFLIATPIYRGTYTGALKAKTALTKLWRSGRTITTPSGHTACRATCRQPAMPKTALPECNGTGCCATSRAPRPVPLRHRANRAQMKPGLSSSADETRGSGHNGLVERFSRRIVEAIGQQPKRRIAHRLFLSHADRDAFLNRFVSDYNRTRLKCLEYLAPAQALANPPGPNTHAGRGRRLTSA